MIFYQSMLDEHSFLPVNPDLATVWQRLPTILPRSLSLDVVNSDTLSINSNHLLQKWLNFGAIQQRFADGNSVQEVFISLTRVAPIHRVTFCILPYLYEIKWILSNV